MTQNTDDAPEKTASQKLADLMARRKADAGRAPGGGVPGQRQSERAAAARATAQSKPSGRK